MLVSVAIVLYKSDEALLRANLRSLYDAAACAAELRLDFKLICYLIDNAKQPNITTLLNSLPQDNFCQMEYVKNPSNTGYGAANNVIADSLSSDFHLIMNPDVVVDVNVIHESINYLTEHGGAGMLTPQIANAHNYGSHVVKRYPDCLTLFTRFLGWRKLKPFFKERLDRYACEDLGQDLVQSVELAGGCFFFLRTQDYLVLKGFDSRYFLYFEDFDFCLRLRKRGLTIDYVPSVKISHAGGDVGRKAFRHHLYFIVSAVRFFSLHGWRFW
jgi:GT2 family glycosyltransferase